MCACRPAGQAQRPATAGRVDQVALVGPAGRSPARTTVIQPEGQEQRHEEKGRQQDKLAAAAPSLGVCDRCAHGRMLANSAFMVSWNPNPWYSHSARKATQAEGKKDDQRNEREHEPLDRVPQVALGTELHGGTPRRARTRWALPGRAGRSLIRPWRPALFRCPAAAGKFISARPARVALRCQRHRRARPELAVYRVDRTRRGTRAIRTRAAGPGALHRATPSRDPPAAAARRLRAGKASARETRDGPACEGIVSMENMARRLVLAFGPHVLVAQQLVDGDVALESDARLGSTAGTTRSLPAFHARGPPATIRTQRRLRARRRSTVPPTGVGRTRDWQSAGSFILRTGRIRAAQTDRPCSSRSSSSLSSSPSS